MMDRLDEFKGVPLGSLKRYLTFRGWRTVLRPQRGFELYVFTESNQADVEIVLPASNRAPDVLKQIGFAIRSLSQLENRDTDAVVADIRSMGFDVVRSRLPDRVVRHDAIRLEVAEGFIRGIKRLLAASASTEILPDRFYGRIRKEAQAYAEECRFGHTFRGSFGFTIESPLAPNLEPAFEGIDQAPPFERRVIQRLARGLQSVQIAGEQDDPGLIADRYRAGFSANMCDEFAELVEATGGESVTFDFSLSPEWQAPADIGRAPTFEVQPQSIELVKEAAKQLRYQEFDRNREIVGRIVRLQSENDPTDLLHPAGREVTIQWVSPDLGELNVKVFLQPEDYLVAVEAHKNGRPVKVSGVLDRMGRTWVLSMPRAFNERG